MAFRNPLQSLSVDFADITGMLAAGQLGPGVVNGPNLSATAIDGMLITGSTIQTAWYGKRWVIGSAPQNLITGYSGNAAETSPGSLKIDVDGSGNPLIELKGPVANGSAPTLRLTASGLLGGTDLAELYSSRGTIGPLTWFTHPATSRAVNLNPAPGGDIGILGGLIVDGDITLAGKISGQPYTVSGSIVATPNASGQISIPYGVTFTTIPYPVCNPGSTAGLCNAMGASYSTSAGGATLYDYAGALITSGLRRVNWTVTGILT